MIDIIVMFQKHHFYTLLGVIFMVCSFVLNYFEKKYVLFLIGWTGVGVGLDLVWMIVHASVWGLLFFRGFGIMDRAI